MQFAVVEKINIVEKITRSHDETTTTAFDPFPLSSGVSPDVSRTDSDILLRSLGITKNTDIDK